jgi:vesicular inhibitory amino acid transporter
VLLFCLVIREAQETECAGNEVEIPKANEPDSTAAEALYNCVNILLGCGVLTIPYALNEGGWAALGVLALMGLSTNYTGPGLFLCSSFFLCMRVQSGWIYYE